MPHPIPNPADVAPVLAALERDRQKTIDDLSALTRIPGVSAEGFPRAPLAESARAVADLLTGAGIENVRIVEHQPAPPYVVGDWLHAPGAPTLLIYGHHDVQPAGDPSRWHSPPWQPTERNGRLYGRGVADDKAGVMSHLAAVRAWFAAHGRLPVNVKFLIEGEEETGSPHLADFLGEHREALAADCLVLTDTCNLDQGIPSLTVSLRGLVMADVTVSALSGPVHSGIWGGPLPDPVQALAKLLARLSDDKGRVAIPGIRRDEAPTPAFASLPFDAGRFRAQGGVLPGVELLTDGGAATYWASWMAPVVTVSGLDAVPVEQSSNQIMPSARARVGVRLAPDQNPEQALKALVDFLGADPPLGCRVEVSPDVAAGGWLTAPEGPFFDAARRALEAGYGHPAAPIGCGGSIPFVEPFARAMGDIPALLLGVEDPECRAHGENESLHLGDFESACRAAAYLYGELGRNVPGNE